MSDFIEDLQKAIDQVKAASDDSPKYRYFCYTEEGKKLIKKYDPSADVTVFPTHLCKGSSEKDKVYVLPVEELKPIKLVVEDPVKNVGYKLLASSFGVWNLKENM